MLTNCRASVIIPTYNRLKELNFTLNSLTEQITEHIFEVIVADDGSTEDAKGLVENFIGKLNIRYCFQEDKGFRAAAARNMGIKLAEGDICIFVDNGIALHPAAVNTHIETHLTESSPCVVIGYIYGFNTEKGREDEIKSIIDNKTLEEAISILHNRQIGDVREYMYRELGEEINNWPAPFVVCWSGNLSVSRNVLLSIGMYDEYFTSWGNEDDDLGLSLFRNKIQFVLARSASSIHYPHPKMHEWDTNWRAEQARLKVKKQYMYDKHPIPEMGLWTYVNDPVDLNKALKLFL